VCSSDTCVPTSGTERQAEEGRCCCCRGADSCSGYLHFLFLFLFLLFIFVRSLKQKRAGVAAAGALTLVQVKCDRGVVSLALLSQLAFDASTSKPLAKVVAISVAASAAQARAC